MVSLLFACEEQKVEIFDGGNAIYFDKFYTDAIYPGLESADSTVVSFFFYPDDTREVQAALLVNLMGGSLQTDMTFQLKVVEDATTANPDEYKLADQYVFEARPDSVYESLIQEYIYIDLFKSDRLQNGEVESVCLVAGSPTYYASISGEMKLFLEKLGKYGVAGKLGGAFRYGIAVSAEDVGDSLKFVKENEEVTVSLYQEKPFAIEPPLTVELQVTETEPGFKGNTAQGATKPAIVETGAQVSVPLFVDQGEMIKIDTRTGEYLSRV